jgi:CRISPR-associated protein Csx10
MRFYYYLHTLDPVVLTEQATATLQHTSLDFISGHTLLGAMAAKHYARLSTEMSWMLFHSGLVRFSPAYLVDQHQVCLPTPLCWQQPKKSKQSDKACNNLHPDFKSNNELWQAVAQPYVCASGGYSRPKMQRITRTALDDTKGIAKEAALYSYRAIEAGQTFLFWIETEDQAAQATLQEILAQPMTLRIGRSRSTEYGGVQLEPLSDTSFAQDWLQPSSDDAQLVLWCLADAECFTQTGQPTYTPALADISEGHGQLNTHKSQIKTKRIRRFNQKRKGFDGEQLLISKGSVLVYDLVQPLSLDERQALQRQGLGVNQQQGLGWISVNPDWLSFHEVTKDSLKKLRLQLPCSKHALANSTALENPTETPLIRWVQDQVTADQSKEQNIQNKNKLIAAVLGCYKNARAFKGILNAQSFGVSKSQWGKVKEVVDFSRPDAWYDKLFVSETSICHSKSDPQGWGCFWLEGNRSVNFAEAFKKHIDAFPKDQQQPILQRFCESIINYDLSDYAALQKAKKQLIHSHSADKESSDA